MFLAHDAHQVHVPLGIDLQLEQRVLPRLARLAAYVGLACEADREGCRHRHRSGQPSHTPRSDAGLFGTQVPERAVERVARAAGRQQLQEGVTGDGVVQGAT